MYIYDERRALLYRYTLQIHGCLVCVGKKNGFTISDVNRVVYYNL